jgi:ABC-type dipeptide/oligopeptide/nickel transport system ATPase subunit
VPQLPVRFDVEVPYQSLECWAYLPDRVERKLKNMRDGGLHSSFSVHGIHRLKPETAAELDHLLDGGEPATASARQRPVLLAVVAAGRAGALLTDHQQVTAADDHGHELTAVENVELPQLLAGRSPGSARRRALELLDRTGLADRARFLPSALSGGQRQRVAATLEVLGLFDDLHRAGQTLVIVTHDSRIAAAADRLIAMSDGAFTGETRLAGGAGRLEADR